MGKYEKKRKSQRTTEYTPQPEADYSNDCNFDRTNDYSASQQSWGEAPRRVRDDDGYSLDNLRQVHEGRAVYDTTPRPIYESSSARGSQAARNQSSYTQAAYNQPNPYGQAYSQTPPPEKPRRRKKKHRLLWFILHIPITLLGLVILAVLASILFAKMPQSDKPIGPRKDGCCTILLCGTDAEGARTDAMLLLYLDRNDKTTRLLSLPRDTMVNRDNPVPKLNGAYWANGGDSGNTEKGMDALLGYVKDLVGYRPDAYILLDLECFSDLVDAMGGVSFDVPMDMYYDDPSQDLHIDLKAGLQTLNGKEAMELIRFRSGYSMADLQRVEVQRDFLNAAFKQWKSLLRLPRATMSVRLLTKNAETDLGYRNFCWIALSLVKGTASNFESDTLPGEPAWVNGGAYYVENREKTAALINEKYNPYETEIKAENLHPYGK